MGKKIVEVVAGVIYHNRRVLACERPAGKKHAGKWEFPGGKIEKGETAAQALMRELTEELALKVSVLDEMYRLQLVQSDGSELVLHFLRAVKSPASEPVSCESQRFCWLEPDELYSVDWLETDLEFVDFIARGTLRMGCKTDKL